MAAILITGITGGLSQLTAKKLVAQGHEVVGIDYRPPPDLPYPVYQANYNKTGIEDVFKKHKFDTVLHLGRVGNLKESVGKRFDLNVVGSQKIMNLCVQHGVTHLVVLSTFHIYGAHPANHIPIAESEPLRAGSDFPQLADAIQLDNLAMTWVFQHPTVRTVVLRPTNVIGPSIQNAMSTFLRARTVPHVAGFNPMTQFIHEEDLSDAILCAGTSTERGVFNVAGRGACPWRTALELARADTFPVPSSLVWLYLRTFSKFPAYLVNFFKYPCVITDNEFREKFAWEPLVPISDAIWSTVQETREQAA